MNKKKIIATFSAIALLFSGTIAIYASAETEKKNYELYGVYPDDFTSDEIEEIKSTGALKTFSGDTDKNGVINTADLIQMASFILRIEDMTILQKINSDINSDFRIDSIDYLLLKRIIMNYSDNSETGHAVEPIDAEQFLDRIGKIENQTYVKDSNACLSEKDVLRLLKGRGFEDVTVVCSFDMDGNLTDEKLITEENATSVIHPIYDVYYESVNNEIWCISVVNGSIYASPLIYNFKEDLTVAVIISETGYITSYDNVTNKFFEVKLDPTEILIKKTELITAEYLLGLTEEEIDNL